MAIKYESMEEKREKEWQSRLSLREGCISSKRELRRKQAAEWGVERYFSEKADRL